MPLGRSHCLPCSRTPSPDPGVRSVRAMVMAVAIALASCSPVPEVPPAPPDTPALLPYHMRTGDVLAGRPDSHIPTTTVASSTIISDWALTGR
jgi:hypothetical protein